jgi:hypothetical protein
MVSIRRFIMRLSRSPALLLLLASFLFGCSKSTSPTAPLQSDPTAAALNHSGGGHDSTHVEFRGKLTAISGTTLTVGAQQVTTDTSTKVTKGHARITVADLVVGDSLEVEGSRQADQSVLAREIEVVIVVQRMQFVSLADTITSVSVPDNKFGVGDSTVFVNSATRFNDHNTLDSLKVGEHVRVLAVRQADGSLLALTVQVREGDDGENPGDDDGDHHGGHGDNGHGRGGDDDGGQGKSHGKGGGHH